MEQWQIVNVAGSSLGSFNRSKRMPSKSYPVLSRRWLSVNLGESLFAKKIPLKKLGTMVRVMVALGFKG